MASSTSEEKPVSAESEPKWLLAKRGIDLLINNKGKEAEDLFLEHQESLQMYAGYAIVLFMDALMTFEEDKLEKAISTLKDLEKRCSADKGWFKSMRLKVFGNQQDTSESLAHYLESQVILADSLVFLSTLTFLQQDLSGYFKGGWILRKSWKLYQSTYVEISKLYKELVGDTNLPVLQVQQENENEKDVNNEGPEDMNCFVNEKSSIDEKFEKDDEIEEITPPKPRNNGYRPTSSFHPQNQHPKESFSCHSNLSSLASNNDNPTCDTTLANSSNFNGCRTPHTSIYKHTHQQNGLKKSVSFNSALVKHSERNRKYNSISLSYFTSTFNIFTSNERLKAHDLDKETITRLMSAVCFGYGLFQLGVSLLPPALLKITNILGFSGNRQVGVENLMFARLGCDMRAPLATLSLLWYHTIVRPFYALDGSNVQAGVHSATQLIDEAQEKYSESALFLFFKGRVERLQSEIATALLSFQKSVDNATQREMKILSKHELGWCYLIQLDFIQAENTFIYMRNCSRWSRSFYAYLATISAGTYNNFKDINQVKQMKEHLERSPKGTQLEEFLLRRYRICPSTAIYLEQTTPIFWRMLVYELLYLWNTLPSCNSDNIRKILLECQEPKEEVVMTGLSELLSGVCYCILSDFDNGVSYFRQCLEVRKNIPHNAPDAHVSAFAQYELALLLLKYEETRQEGKQLLQQISQYKDYDFEQRLSVRIHMILKQL